MTVRKVAMLTAGGLAPCLSSAVAGLVERWSEVAPDVELVGYRDGYAGLLKGDSVTITPAARAEIGRLHSLGGSPLGNSRVKLTNVADARKRGLVGPDEEPLEVAARRLRDDGVDVLHTIGGDDTNTTAADLAAYLADNGYELTVVGLPKTVDNDIVPVRQSLGAWTAAEQSAMFARNIVGEHSASSRMLVVHEVMGRHCGWLTASAAKLHHDWASTFPIVPDLVEAGRWDVHGVYVPELSVDIAAEAERLRPVMDRHGSVNLFVGEGAGVHDIVAEMERRGDEVPRDPFGHVKLDLVNPGQWFAQRIAEALGAEKVMVWKSGYFARSAPANTQDLELIKACVDVAVAAAVTGTSGLVGNDEEHGDELRAIEFPRVAGGKAFDTTVPWFTDLARDVAQHR